MISNNLTPPETVIEATVYCIDFIRDRGFRLPTTDVAMMMGHQLLSGEMLIVTSSPVINAQLDKIYGKNSEDV